MNNITMADIDQNRKPVPTGSIRHAEGEQEHSLCGMAFDAYDSGDSDEEIIFAGDGETVTCPQCRAHLDYIRSHFRRYRYWLPNNASERPAADRNV